MPTDWTPRLSVSRFRVIPHLPALISQWRLTRQGLAIAGHWRNGESRGSPGASSLESKGLTASSGRSSPGQIGIGRSSLELSRRLTSMSCASVTDCSRRSNWPPSAAVPSDSRRRSGAGCPFERKPWSLAFQGSSSRATVPGFPGRSPPPPRVASPALRQHSSWATSRRSITHDVLSRTRPSAGPGAFPTGARPGVQAQTWPRIVGQVGYDRLPLRRGLLGRDRRGDRRRR